MILLDLTFTEAVVAGVVPFILGDIIKPQPPVLLPGAWKLVVSTRP